MLKNLLVTALRNFRKNSGSFLINVFGLTVGLTSCSWIGGRGCSYGSVGAPLGDFVGVHGPKIFQPGRPDGQDPAGRYGQYALYGHGGHDCPVLIIRGDKDNDCQCGAYAEYGEAG